MCAAFGLMIEYASNQATSFTTGNPGGNSGSRAGLWARAAYFCQVRFLCRLAFKRFLRLCFDILRRRFFLRFPMFEMKHV